MFHVKHSGVEACLGPAPAPYHRGAGPSADHALAIWGTVVGGAAVLLVAGPLGALLGGVAGHVLERWLREWLARDSTPIDGPAAVPAETRRVAVATATIVLAAKLAKADGAVSRLEVDTFKDVFDVRDEDVGGIAPIFDEAKRTPEGFELHARQLATIFAYEPGILEELLDQLFVLAAADGELDVAEIAWLARVAAIFGLDGPPFEAILARYGTSQTQPQGRSDDASAYRVLGLDGSASDAEVKAAWRRLVRQNHPDRLAAEGGSDEQVRQANGRLATINAAYDRIARERGLV